MFSDDPGYVFCDLTLLFERLDDLANGLRSMSVCLLYMAWRHHFATYIFHSGVLVDLALQIFEDTLTEKRVCRHGLRSVL